MHSRHPICVRRVVTLGAGLLAGVWSLMLVAGPYLVAHDHTSGAGAMAAAATYVAGGVVCHQQPSRSFRLWDIQMPVCARCSGVYALAPVGLVLAQGRRGRRADSRRSAGGARPIWSVRAVRMVLLVTAAPTVMTVGAELVGVIDSSNLLRAVSALPLGFSVTWVVGLALSAAIDETR